MSFQATQASPITDYAKDNWSLLIEYREKLINPIIWQHMRCWLHKHH